MSATALSANVGLMCRATAPEVSLGPLCFPKRQHLSLHFLHGESMNTANQYREWQSRETARWSVESATRQEALAV